MEIRASRRLAGVTLMDKLRNGVIKEGILRWFGHLARINERRLTKPIYKASVNEQVGKGRPRSNWGCPKDIPRTRIACTKELIRVVEAKDVGQDHSK